MSCLSMAAPCALASMTPELPTTAQVRHRWRRSRCFMSASGSALYAGPLMRNVSFCMPGGLANPANSGSCSWLPQPPAGKPPSRGSSGMNTLLNHSIPSSRTLGGDHLTGSAGAARGEGDRMGAGQGGGE